NLSTRPRDARVHPPFPPRRSSDLPSRRTGHRLHRPLVPPPVGARRPRPPPGPPPGRVLALRHARLRRRLAHSRLVRRTPSPPGQRPAPGRRHNPHRPRRPDPGPRLGLDPATPTGPNPSPPRPLQNRQDPSPTPNPVTGHTQRPHDVSPSPRSPSHATAPTPPTAW